MNPERTLNDGVMNERASLKFLWEVPYMRVCVCMCVYVCVRMCVCGWTCVCVYG